MTDKDDNRGADQARAQFESIKEMIENLPDWQAAAESEGWTGPHKDEFGAIFFACESDGAKWCCANWRELCLAHDIEPDQDSDDARQRIEEDALSVEVRSDWYTPGNLAGMSPAEYRILLCTGGPAVQIVGQLSEHGEPETATLQHQDWFKPWTDWSGNSHETEQTLIAYARCFYFGE